MKYDVAWYWVGGAERGEWRGCEWSEGVVERLNRQGYYAVHGLIPLGAPEGPPRDWLAWDDARKHPAGRTR